jgi:protein-L-isoaspartate(D-aspartate) O-methyltransferase
MAPANLVGAPPSDRIIVTCGIDHIPRRSLSKLRPNGVTVIPVGPPAAQHILKVVRRTGADGPTTVGRADIFCGKVIPFVPMTGDHQPS